MEFSGWLNQALRLFQSTTFQAYTTCCNKEPHLDPSESPPTESISPRADARGRDTLSTQAAAVVAARASSQGQSLGNRCPSKHCSRNDSSERPRQCMGAHW